MARRKLYAECRLLGAFGAEDVDRPVERIGLHDLAHQSCQAFSPFAEVDRLRRHHHPYRTCRSNRLAAFSAPMIAAAIAASAPGQTHTLEPSMSNSISAGARQPHCLQRQSWVMRRCLPSRQSPERTAAHRSLPPPCDTPPRRQANNCCGVGHDDARHGGPNAFLEALGTIAAFSRRSNFTAVPRQ